MVIMGEQLLLILLKEKKGKTPGNLGMFVRNVIPATIVEELRILGKIKTEGEGKSANILLLDTSPTNEPVLDSVLSEISNHIQSGNTLNLVKYLKSLKDKKGKWEEKLWNDLEQKGIIQNQKSKHILIKPEVKKKIDDDFLGILGNKIKPNDIQKSLVGFFKHCRQLRYASKKSDRDKEWINSFTEDLMLPKVFAKNVLLGAALKKSAKMISAVSAVGAQIQSAGTSFQSSVSDTVSDFKQVRSVGSPMQKSWAGLQHERGLKEGSTASGGGSVGDAILKGAKKLKEKLSNKEKEE